MDIESLIDLTYGSCIYIYHYVSKIMLCPGYGELSGVLEFNPDFFGVSGGALYALGTIYILIETLMQSQRETNTNEQ
jgi:hypothetical protein